MGRHILHVDCNAYYASVEQQRNPSLRNKPIAVCGSQEERNGIVLTASYPAKRRGVKTGMAIWQAKQHCPDLIIVPPDMDEYMRISRLARDIYESYTDQVEPFGLDESWLDITGSTEIFGSPMKIAQEISDRVKFELGITVSIGVSNNKVTAKLGSDYKKPDAIILDVEVSPLEYTQAELRSRMQQINCALQEKGYNPTMQLVGYILTEDPTYITNHNNARKLISRIGREDSLRDIVESYFET